MSVKACFIRGEVKNILLPPPDGADIRAIQPLSALSERALPDRDHKLHVGRMAFQFKELANMFQRYRAGEWTEALAMLDTIVHDISHLFSIKGSQECCGARELEVYIPYGPGTNQEFHPQQGAGQRPKQRRAGGCIVWCLAGLKPSRFQDPCIPVLRRRRIVCLCAVLLSRCGTHATERLARPMIAGNRRNVNPFKQTGAQDLAI